MQPTMHLLNRSDFDTSKHSLRASGEELTKSKGGENMSFDLIKKIGEIVEKPIVKAFEIFGIAVCGALILLFGNRFIDFAIYAMTEGLEFILMILAAA